MEFTEGKYRLRNGQEIDVTYRHHGWGLSSQTQIASLGDRKPHWRTWVIQGRTGHYMGGYATMQLSESRPGFDMVAWKMVENPSQYDILEKL